MKVSPMTLMKALEALDYLSKQSNAPEGLQYLDVLDARVELKVLLKSLDKVEVEE
jgi:hypothetical protein